MKQRCGTVGFVSPELLTGLSYDWKTDVYSVGTILYMMLTGKPPFAASQQEHVKRKNKLGEVKYPDSLVERVSPPCFDFLQAILQKDPEQRPTAEEALEHEWLKIEEPPAVRLNRTMDDMRPQDTFAEIPSLFEEAKDGNGSLAEMASFTEEEFKHSLSASMIEAAYSDSGGASEGPGSPTARYDGKIRIRTANGVVTAADLVG